MEQPAGRSGVRRGEGGATGIRGLGVRQRESGLQDAGEDAGVGCRSRDVRRASGSRGAVPPEHPPPGRDRTNHHYQGCKEGGKISL
jgi:hypothetical protein